MLMPTPTPTLLSALETLPSELLLSVQQLLPSLSEEESLRLIENLTETLALNEMAIPSLAYSPQSPTAKQSKFLDLDCREAFYGGAAGPGKSSALLMAASQYVHVPGYAALLLRRDYPRLSLPGGLMDRAKEWWVPMGVEWHDDRKTFTFPSGATITLGYYDRYDDRLRYQSSEYQFIGIDELTEIPSEDWYTWLFSRLRRVKTIPVPLRVRGASNPGGPGHRWVKKRFVSEEAIADIAAGEYRQEVYQQPDGTAFVPGLLKDNPYLDAEQYEQSLSHLDPLTRARLKAGDWSVSESGLIRANWLRYYDISSGHMIRFYDTSGKQYFQIDDRDCRRMMICDPAGTSQERMKESKGKPPSWSVISVFDLTPPDKGSYLVWRDVWRERVDFPDLCERYEQMFREWRPHWHGAENEKLGQALIAVLKRNNVYARAVPTEGKDKVTRAAPLLNKMEAGRVFLPLHASWRETLEDEMLAWQGLDDETCDQIDTGAYAATIDFHRLLGGRSRILPIVGGVR